jgi:hypothetical protein
MRKTDRKHARTYRGCIEVQRAVDRLLKEMLYIAEKTVHVMLSSFDINFSVNNDVIIAEFCVIVEYC